MHITPVSKQAVGLKWQWMRPILSKAIVADTSRTEQDVLDALSNGELTAFIVEGEAQGLIVTQSLKDTLWVIYVGGEIIGPVIASMQHLMRGLEVAATKAGCTQIHIMGRRGWIRALAALGFQSQPSKDGLFHIWKDI